MIQKNLLSKELDAFSYLSQAIKLEKETKLWIPSLQVEHKEVNQQGLQAKPDVSFDMSPLTTTTVCRNFTSHAFLQDTCVYCLQNKSEHAVLTTDPFSFPTDFDDFDFGDPTIRTDQNKSDSSSSDLWADFD